MWVVENWEEKTPKTQLAMNVIPINIYQNHTFILKRDFLSVLATVLQFMFLLTQYVISSLYDI